jgi:hypothetical protein
VTFAVFKTSDCSGEAPPEFGGITSWPVEDGLSAITDPDWDYDAQTGLFTPPAGDMSILATWAEDANYHGAEASCEPLRVSRVDPAIVTKVIVRDRAQVTGALSVAPTGLVTIYTYSSDDCTGDAVSTFVLALPASGTGIVEQSASYERVLEVGANKNVASYLASYEGDLNYNAKDHVCEQVVFNAPPPGG